MKTGKALVTLGVGALAVYGAVQLWQSASRGAVRAEVAAVEVRAASSSMLRRGLGERCSNDCQCDSRECKLFKCVDRDYNLHPLLRAGQKCRFKGDCAGCSCVAFTCQ